MINSINRRVLYHFDYLIIIIVALIVATSIFLIYEIDSRLTIKQIVYVSITIIVGLSIFMLPIKRLFWLVPFYYWLAIALLISVEFIGMTKYGAQRWIEIPLIGMSIQPSEIIKSALILMMAYNIKNDPPQIDGYHIKGFLKHSFFIILPAILVKIQPDLGTSMLILVMGYGVLFIVGIQKKILISICAFIIVISPLLYSSLDNYQLDRINQFLSDNPQHQVRQSMIAIGSGGIFGKNKEDATQARFKFLPVPESDFIIAYLGERFGFVGVTIIILLYSLLVFHLFTLSYAYKKDKILQVITSSLGFLVFCHLSVNVAMTIKLAPIVGIPLPFFSYGGSSFLTFGILFAITENLLAFRYDFRI